MGGDSATIDNFSSAELTADASGVFPPCQPAKGGEGFGEDSSTPCVPIPCVEKNGEDGQWFVPLHVDSFDISPYELQNEFLQGGDDHPKQEAILQADDNDSDYSLHVKVSNADEVDPAAHLACSADLDLSP
jgi:hypothetical protein